MSKVLEFLNGKKTYLVAGVAALIGVLQIFGVIGIVPEYVWTLLGAAGLGAVRDALGKVQK